MAWLAGLLIASILTAAAGAAAGGGPVPGPHVWTPAGRLPTAVPLQVHEGRLAVPLRDLAAAAGALVAWDPATRQARVAGGAVEIALRPGARSAEVAGQGSLELPFAPYFQGNSLMVPAREVLTALEVRFRWDGTGLWLTDRPASPAAAAETLLLDDSGYGLRMTFADPWQLHGDLAPVVLVLERPGARLEITTEQLRAASSPEGAVAYSSRSVEGGWNGIVPGDTAELRVGGQRAWFRAWERPALPLAEDRRRYAQWDVLRPDRVLTTVTLKATGAAWAGALAEAEAMVGSLQFRTPAWGHGWNRPAGSHRTDWVRWRQKGRLQWELPAPGRPMFGLFDPVIRPQPDFQIEPLRRLEQDLGGRFPFLMTYQAVGDPFPTEMMQQLAQDGRLVMLTLQPWEPTDPYYAYANGSSLTFRILRGEFDDYFRRYARAMKDLGEPLLLRYGNEMNGDWAPWSAFQLGRDADLYVEEWRHVRRIFDQEGVTNAAWVWNPHDVSFPYLAWNHAVRYYPGDEWVDWIGLTGYNVGEAYAGDRWRGFREIFQPVYDEYSALFPGKPFLITEFASHDYPGDKAAWMREMAAALPEFPNIRMVVWWNGTDGSRRYRYDSTPEALAAFREALGAPYLSDTVTWRAP